MLAARERRGGGLRAAETDAIVDFQVGGCSWLRDDLSWKGWASLVTTTGNLPCQLPGRDARGDRDGRPAAAAASGRRAQGARAGTSTSCAVLPPAQCKHGVSQWVASVKMCHCQMDGSEALLVAPAGARVTTPPVRREAATTLSDALGGALAELLGEHAGLIEFGGSYGAFDRGGKTAFLDQVGRSGRARERPQDHRSHCINAHHQLKPNQIKRRAMRCAPVVFLDRSHTQMLIKLNSTQLKSRRDSTFKTQFVFMTNDVSQRGSLVRHPPRHHRRPRRHTRSSRSASAGEPSSSATAARSRRPTCSTRRTSSRRTRSSRASASSQSRSSSSCSTTRTAACAPTLTGHRDRGRLAARERGSERAAAAHARSDRRRDERARGGRAGRSGTTQRRAASGGRSGQRSMPRSMQRSGGYSAALARSEIEGQSREWMNLVANPPTPCRIGKRPPAPENRPAIEEPRGGGGTKGRGRALHGALAYTPGRRPLVSPCHHLKFVRDLTQTK